MPYSIPSISPKAKKSYAPLLTRHRRSNSKRAFQIVPRSMRRRTASHNVKRVPKRLRSRAQKEMLDDNTPIVTARRRKKKPRIRLRLETAKKLRRLSQNIASKGAAVLPAQGVEIPLENVLRKPKVPRSKFLKRQKDKTWLPTHVWHAKRAHMTNRWKYAIAESPNEKSYRPTHRASTLRGAVAWDCSYFNTVLIKGAQSDLIALLRHMLDPAEQPDVIGKGLIRLGKRHWYGWVYEKDEFPTKPIAPVQLLWRVPESKGSDVSVESKPQRQILLRVHPSAFLQLWKTLMLAKASYAAVTVEDLRYELGSIVIRGPASTAALLAVLQPDIEGAAPDSPESLWTQLQHLTNTSTLPPGATLAFNCQDPRITYPPRTQQPSNEVDANLVNLLSSWPVDRTQRPSGLFSREFRGACIAAKASQRRINMRRSTLAPGALPPPLPTDPEIPVIVFANRYSEPNISNKHGLAHLHKNAIGGWTVLLPWRWVQPIWYCLMHVPGVRFGGLDELAQTEYENNAGSFPSDFPGTKSGIEEEQRKSQKRKLRWEMRPKAKRIAWESVDLGNGRKGEHGRGDTCDWQWLVQNIKKEYELKATVAKENASSSGMDLDEPSVFPNAQPILPRSSDPKPTLSPEETALQNALHPTDAPWLIPFHLINRVLASTSKFLPRELSSLPLHVLSRSVFSISIHLLHRGHPNACARIYRLPPDPSNHIRKAWLALEESHERFQHADDDIQGPRYNRQPNQWAKRKSMQDLGASKKDRKFPPPKPLQPGKEGYPVVPGEEDLIGFVITGGYNLKEGKGTAVGALSLGRVVDLLDGLDQEKRTGKNSAAFGRLCIIREAGSGVGRLARWYLRP